MNDVREGDYLTRSKVSSNRSDIYDCFSALTVDTVKEYSNWGDNAAPFSFLLPNFTILGV